MKKSLLVLIAVGIISIFFNSCSEQTSSEIQAETTKSSALRSILNGFKVQNNISGKSTQTNDFCFDFVYPITLSYSNGTTVVATSQASLISLLTTENSAVYIDGIVFPFQVVLASTSTTQTITTEAQLWTLVESCNIPTNDDYVFTGPCYDFVYPLSVVTYDNQTVVVPNYDAFLALFTSPSSTTVIVDFVYPFSVVYQNQTVVISNSYDFWEINENCTIDSSCNCPTIYAPVCVNIGNNDIVEFPNSCTAECAGFTSADFVVCTNSDDDNDNDNDNGFSEILNNCLAITYPVGVQYNGMVASVTTNAELMQYTYPNAIPLFVYPIQVSLIGVPNSTTTISSELEFITFVMQTDCN
jgi:hypothetical protein